MTPSRPYLIRAMYDWIVDNRMTPHILVNADNEQVQVPGELVEDDKIVLNIGPMAVQSLDLGQDMVRFDARFSGSSISVVIPVKCVCAIYARENGQGMMFPEDDDLPPATGPGKPDRSHLRAVK
ncbi:MAG: ClpXP protease specificity-enhancing factor [Proteobacteria bacterium]|nr:ClpXP protease specificity-enhancing factor [Pseudomonadota bacterium]